MPFEIRRDVPLAAFNTFGIAARAAHFARVESTDDLEGLRERPEWALPRLVLGGGSNILLTGDFDGLVVQMALGGHRLVGDDGTHRLVAASAGEDWDGFVRTTLAAGWPGLENLAFIPGSVGAAPVQNIGAYGIELAERFAWLDAFDVATGRIETMDFAACGFGYRDSVFKGGLAGRRIIIRVVFRLPLRWEARLDYDALNRRIADRVVGNVTALDVADAVTAIRREKLPDPAVLGNAGSFFKNPVVTKARFDAMRATEPNVVGHSQSDGSVKLAAAWLIESCGWRGRSLPGSSGRAAVHDRHALILVNRGGATGREVLHLAEAIRDSVSARFEVVLEPEPRIV